MSTPLRNEKESLMASELPPEVSTPPPPERQGAQKVQTWVNWVLALLTVPGAAAVIYYALGAALSIAACSDKQCPNLGPNGVIWAVMLYGAPVVAAATIIISVFTATRRRGFVVPLCGWALLVLDVVALAIAFRH